MSEVQKGKKLSCQDQWRLLTWNQMEKKKTNKDFVFCLFKKVSYFGFTLFKNSKTKADSTAIGM